MSEPIILDDGFTVPTRYWHRLADGRVQCDVCPRACKLHEGQRGVCFVRGRNPDPASDGIVLTTYGRSSGYCIDPIEKKPLNHFYPGTPVLSFGTAGCNLVCRFCQNWDISKSKQIHSLGSAATPRAIAEAAVELGCTSVAFTYNDPVIFLEYARDTAIACRERGIKTVAVTAGYVCPEPRVEMFRHIDAVNVDLKAFDEDFYRHLTGSSLAVTLETISYLCNHTDVWVELTNLVIPGHNDSDDEIRAMCEWVVAEVGPDVPIHFSAFHPDFRMLDTPPTPPETLARARSIALESGVHHAYTGNVHDADGDTTWCPACGAAVIVRDWYQIRSHQITDDGRCGACGHVIHGRFDGPRGNWGRRRQPVSIEGRGP